jgi:hypothetical protein
LLIQNEKLGAPDRPLTSAQQFVEKLVTSLDRVNVQTAVSQLLTSLGQRSGSLNVREDTPIPIRDAADKFPHRTSVYLI